MGFSLQKYWSGLPFPSPRHLPDLRLEPMFPALAGGFFTTEPPGKPFERIENIINIHTYMALQGGLLTVTCILYTADVVDIIFEK